MDASSSGQLELDQAAGCRRFWEEIKYKSRMWHLKGMETNNSSHPGVRPRKGVKEDLPVVPEMGTQEQATPQEDSRPSALGKFCSKWPSLRPRPQSSGDWCSVKSVSTRTHVQTCESQIQAWLRGLVSATLRASPECLGVNPRAHKILFPTCLSSHIADLFPGRLGSSGFPPHILHILHAIPWFPLPCFHSRPSQHGPESPPHFCQLLHIWSFLLDPGGWRR